MAGSDSRVRGAAELHVDSKGLEARFHITKDEEAPEWSVDSLKELLAKKGVITGFTDETLDAALKKAAASSEPTVEVAVAHGSPPEEPAAERITMEELPIPDELAETAETLLAAAEKPDITIYRTQTVEREKVIEKKRALPFLAKKQERTTVTGKERIPEQVYVDPTVEWTGYAEEGQRLATITPQEPGRSGVSVYGAPLAQKRLADPYVYAAGGVARRQNELFAERSGFVRQGANWVDIVPFADHEWHLAKSKDNATCLLTFHPGHGTADPPSAAEVLEAASQHGFPADKLLPAEELDQLIQDALERDTALVEAPISRSRDADFSIYVSEDKLKAMLTVSKGTGRGKPLVLRELGRTIQKSGLKRLDFEQIKQDITAFYNSTETDLTGYVLAEGNAPVPGPEREIEWSVRFLPEEEVERLHPARIDTGPEDELEEAAELPEAEELEPPEQAPAPEEGDAPARPALFPAEQVTLMAHVEEQQRIGSITPGVAGESGVNVYGQSIPAEPQPEPTIHYYDGVRREKNMIIATRTGLFECAVIDNVSYMRIRLHKDARVAVEISSDSMQAYLTLDPEEGSGKPITEGEVRNAIAEAGVVSGINEETLEKAIGEAAKGSMVERVAFARGTPPENEDTPRVEFLIRMASGKPLSVRDDGSIDYKNQDVLTTVSEEQKIARVLPPEHEAKDGENVTGVRIPAQRIGGKPLTAGTNVRSVADNGVEILVAEIAGEVIIKDDVVSVISQHTIKGDVDLTSGNVKFPGSVHVSGNVRSGFYVVAEGDIKIGEAVEAALLSADGNIVIQQGVKGAGKGVVRSKQNIGAAFAERCTLLSVGDIVLKNSCIHSSLKCNGKVTVKAQNGSLVGGEIRARHGLTVANLGSQTGTQTRVFFGQDYLVADQIEREVAAIEKLKARISELDIAMHKYEKAGEATELEKLRQEKKKHLRVIEKRSLHLFSLREKFEHHFESYVDVLGTVYPGVIVESHSRRHEFRQEKSKIRIYFDLSSGHIQEEPLTQAAQEQTKE